jgi:hypothetical protein
MGAVLFFELHFFTRKISPLAVRTPDLAGEIYFWETRSTPIFICRTPSLPNILPACRKCPENPVFIGLSSFFPQAEKKKV